MSLQYLPTDLLQEASLNLPISDVLKLRTVSKEMKGKIDDKKFWRRYALENLGQSCTEFDSSIYTYVYKKQLKNVQRIAKHLNEIENVYETEKIEAYSNMLYYRQSKTKDLIDKDNLPREEDYLGLISERKMTEKERRLYDSILEKYNNKWPLYIGEKDVDNMFIQIASKLNPIEIFLKGFPYPWLQKRYKLGLDLCEKYAHLDDNDAFMFLAGAGYTFDEVTEEIAEETPDDGFLVGIVNSIR